MYGLQRPYARKWAYAYTQTTDVASITVQSRPFEEYLAKRLVAVGTLSKLKLANAPVVGGSAMLVSFDPPIPAEQYGSYGGSFSVTGGNSDRSWAGLIAGVSSPYTANGFLLGFKTAGGLDVDLSQMEFPLAVRIHSAGGAVVVAGLYYFKGSALNGGTTLFERLPLSIEDDEIEFLLSQA
jgi:hypothetical protein